MTALIRKAVFPSLKNSNASDIHANFKQAVRKDHAYLISKVVFPDRFHLLWVYIFLRWISLGRHWLSNLSINRALYLVQRACMKDGPVDGICAHIIPLSQCMAEKVGVWILQYLTYWHPWRHASASVVLLGKINSTTHTRWLCDTSILHLWYICFVFSNAHPTIHWWVFSKVNEISMRIAIMSVACLWPRLDTWGTSLT